MKKRILAAALALAIPAVALAAPTAPQDPSPRGSAASISPRDKAKATRAQDRRAKAAKARATKAKAAKPAPDSKKAPAT